MFSIKICGITSAADLALAARAGADAVGLNFYPRSSRFVEPAQAEVIAEQAPQGVLKVGVFVNAPLGEIQDAVARCTLDLVQLHGDETPEFLAELKPLPVMRAYRLGAEGLSPIVADLQRCRALDCLPAIVLLDAFRPGQYGGTGQTADWSAAAAYDAGALPPLVLAGGLTPANVAQAIATVRPAAVDTAGGVESSPGKKDPQALAAFVNAARQAFDK